MSTKITIIGAGPGGYMAAFAAAKKGAEVTLVESDFLGGTCLNYGCIPTKTLKSTAEVLEKAHSLSTYGITGLGEAKADMPAVIQRKRKVSEVLRGGIEKTCAQLKVKVLKGRGQIISASLVKVTNLENEVIEVESDKIIIATGSRSLELPALKVDHKHILSSDDALELQYVPESMIIVGGGVIGAELAGIYSTFGAKVTVVEGLSRLLPVPSIDEEMSKLLQREMKKSGIKQELCRIVSACKVENDKVYAELAPSPFLSEVPASAKKEATIEADVLVVAAGRVPNTEGLGLQEAGIETDNRGWVKTNDLYETNVPNIYAIGDILGPSKIMLAHMAYAEGLAIIDNILDSTEKVANYSVVPSGIFTSPEIGCVGITEAQAKEKGIEVECPVFQFRELGKAQAMAELPGCFKMIIEKETAKVLGCHIAGAHATDLIAEAALAMQLGATAYDIAHTIHAHPTLAEGLFELTHNWATAPKK